MKRPQSAKHVSNQRLSSHPDHLQFQKYSNTHASSHGYKLVSNSSNLARLLPKRIPYDKERLYYETIQLKAALNQVSDENHKLKTKIAILEKEKDRIHKVEQTGTRVVRSGTVGQHAEKENLATIYLKKMVRQSKEEADAAKAELDKLKKTIRYSKVNELQIEKQVLVEENKRIAKMLWQLQSELNKNKEYQSEVSEMQRQLRLQADKIRESDDSIARYDELLQEFQLKNRELSQKLVVWEKKYQRDLAEQKRKADQLARANQILKSEKKSLEQNIEKERKQFQNSKKRTRPASSHLNNHAHQPANDNSKAKQQALEINIRLNKELQDAKSKLAVSESMLKQQLADSAFSKSKQPFELILTNKEEELAKEIGKKIEKDNKHIISKADYAENTTTSQNLEEIRGILTYRMKYNRYTFEELKADIQAAPLESLTPEDILIMLIEEPFCLTQHYARQLLNNCYKSNRLSNNQLLSASQLLATLREVIQDFQLLPEEEQEYVLYQIANSITRHRSSLERAFQSLGAAQGAVTSGQMEKILKDHTQLSKEAIDLAICYVVMNAQNLNRISYLQLLDKFLINNEYQSSAKGSKALQLRDESEHSLHSEKEIEGFY